MIAHDFGFTRLFREGANTGCICDQDKSCVKPKDKRGRAVPVTDAC
jgi:hypothetical protein